MSDGKGASWTPWLIGGAVVLMLVLVLRRQGVTTLGDSSAAQDALQAKRLEGGTAAFTALAGALGLQAQADAQARSNIAVAQIEAGSAAAQARAQADAAASANRGNTIKSIGDAAAAVLGAIALF